MNVFLTGSDVEVGGESVPSRVDRDGSECRLEVARACRRLKHTRDAVRSRSALQDASDSRPRWRHGCV